MTSKPSAFGRTISGLLGLTLGGYLAYYLTQDYQLIKYTPLDPNIKDQGKKGFQVSFREMQPLELKPEVKKKLELRRKSDEGRE